MVEYNNRWWFPILEKVEASSIGYDHKNNTGLIALKIFYDDDNVLNAAQFVKFNREKINFIHTYASGVFFTRQNIRVQLDDFGNTIWLKTGYDMNYSAKAAMGFFNSPKGKMFEQHQDTRNIVSKIKQNLKQYISSNEVTS